MTLAWATLTAFSAGVASSVGPCVAPRFLAVASLAAGSSGTRRWSRVATFVAGLCLSYVLFCSVSGVIGWLSAYSGYLYAVLGTCLMVGGVAIVVRTRQCTTCPRLRTNTSYGAIFFAGAAFATVGSPCCAPLAAAVAGAGLADRPAAWYVAVPAAFAIGHALPLTLVALRSARLEDGFPSRWPKAATATVVGALTIAFGSYYALLA